MRISRMIVIALLVACNLWGEVVSEPLLKLLQVMEVTHDGTLSSIVSATQKSWLRPAGTERWHIENDLTDEKKEKLFPLAAQLGFINEMIPSSKDYAYCLILGGTSGRMEKRLKYAAKLWKEGIHFNQIVFLVGARPLDPDVDLWADICKTEIEAAHYIWEHADLPKGFKELPIVFVDVPMIPTEKGQRRPTTGDTVIAWLALHPKPGKCLGISNQPYCLYQEAVIRSYLPKSIDYETAGEATNIKHLNGFNLLDSIARWLYQVQFIRSKHEG